MANAFSKPVASQFTQTYISQHVPMPMEAIMKVMAKKQETQDATVAGIEKQDEANQLNRGAATADQEYIATRNKEFAEAADKLSKTDLTTSDAQSQIKGLVKGITKDPNLIKIKQNQAKVTEYQAQLEKIRESGKVAAPASKYAFEKALAEYEAGGGFKGEKSLPLPQVKEHIHVRPIQEEYFNNIPVSGGDSLQRLGETYYNNGWTGITSKTINSRALQAFQGYARTGAAQQEMEEYDMLVQQGQQPLNNKGEAMSKQEYVFNNFLDAGLERVGGISKSGYADAANAENKRKREEEVSKTLLTEINPLYDGGIKPKFDKDGKIIGSGTTGFFQSLWNDGLQSYFNDKNLNTEEKKSWAHIQLGAHLNGVSEQTMYERMNRMRHIPMNQYVKDATRNAATNALFNPTHGAGAYTTMQVIDLESGEKGINFTEYLRREADKGNLVDSKGNTIDVPSNPSGSDYRDIFKAAGVQVMGFTDPNFATADGIGVSINGKNIIVDRTFGGQFIDHVPEANLKKARASRIATMGAEVIPNSQGVQQVHWLDQREGSKTKGQIIISNLSDVKK